jgi:hypothetical protein
VIAPTGTSLCGIHNEHFEALCVRHDFSAAAADSMGTRWRLFQVMRHLRGRQRWQQGNAHAHLNLADPVLLLSLLTLTSTMLSLLPSFWSSLDFDPKTLHEAWQWFCATVRTTMTQVGLSLLFLPTVFQHEGFNHSNFAPATWK